MSAPLEFTPLANMDTSDCNGRGRQRCVHPPLWRTEVGTLCVLHLVRAKREAALANMRVVAS